MFGRRSIMPKYLIHRTVGQLSEDELDGAGKRSNDALATMPEVRWIRSYYSAEEGKIYCEYEAPSLELLYEHARNAQLPIDGASVVRELAPAMFY
jgi:hypothetical protein